MSQANKWAINQQNSNIEHWECNGLHVRTGKTDKHKLEGELTTEATRDNLKLVLISTRRAHAVCGCALANN